MSNKVASRVAERNVDRVIREKDVSGQSRSRVYVCLVVSD